MRVSLVKSVVLAAFLLGVAPASYADPFFQDELTWLETMAFAAHLTDYSGTFVYQYGSHVETSRITHVVDADGEHGRLESLDGARREIIRNNDEVWCYLGDSKVKVELRSGQREFPALLPDRASLSNINDNYLIKQAGEARVAGFHAHAVLFQPKDNRRYGHRMWADSHSGLLLKAEVLDERGNIVEQYSFTQLTLDGNIDRSWMAAGKPGADSRPGVIPISQQRGAAKVPAAPAASGWKVDAVPAGFRKVTEVRRTLHQRAAPAIQMVFSDGLAGISVFIEENDRDEDDRQGLTSQGAIQIYRTLVDDHLVTVVGEVPPQTVIEVADSVRYAGE